MHWYEWVIAVGLIWLLGYTLSTELEVIGKEVIAMRSMMEKITVSQSKQNEEMINLLSKLEVYAREQEKRHFVDR